jgi:hypothetical protein
MEFIINSIMSIGVMAGAYTLLTRSYVTKFFIGIWALGIIILRFFNDNLAAQFAADFPNIFSLVFLPWIAGVPVAIVLFILKRIFFRGW